MVNLSLSFGLRAFDIWQRLHLAPEVFSRVEAVTACRICLERFLAR